MSAITDLKKKSTLPARQAGGKVVSEFFAQNKQAILAVLPRHLNADRLTKIAMGAIRSTPQLLEATTQSLFGAVIQCAQLGLEPNTPLGHAYLIPFKNRRENRTDVQVIIGYQGMIDIARRSGQIRSIAAHAVRTGDEFHYQYGLHEDLIHIPGDNSGEITHFYAVAHLVGGGHSFEVLSMQDVEETRNEILKTASEWQRQKSPWSTHFEEMGRKTAIRRLWKYLPKSIEMATAEILDATAGTEQQPDLGMVLEGDYQITDTPYVDDENQQEKTTPPVEQQQQEKPENQKTEEKNDTPYKVLTDPQTGEELYFSDGAGYWDSNEHSYPPKLTATGQWRKRRGASKAGATRLPDDEQPPFTKEFDAEEDDDAVSL